MFTEPFMGLTIWNLLTDLYDHNAQANNLTAIGQHDHSTGKGVQISSAGIANSAVIAAKIANGTITTTQISSTAGITKAQLATGAGFFSVSNISVDTAAVDGVYYVTQNGLTVTLPSPVFGARVGVFAFGVTPSTPAVINVPGGGVIIGTGTGNSVTSLVLGTSGSFVTLLGDGGNWAMISGQQDSGWQGMTLQPNISVPAGGVSPASRTVGEGILVKGGFQNNGGTITKGTTIATLATGLPVRNQLLSGGHFGGGSWSPCTYQVLSNGSLNCLSDNMLNGDLLFIAGSSFIGTS